MWFRKKSQKKQPEKLSEKLPEAKKTVEVYFTISGLNDGNFSHIMEQENIHYLRGLRYVKSYLHKLKRHQEYCDSEICMDELYKKGEDYYLRLLRAFCSSEGNCRPSSHIWDYLYKIDDIKFFNYKEFQETYHMHGECMDLVSFTDDKFIKIIDRHGEYGEPLPSEYRKISKIARIV